MLDIVDDSDSRRPEPDPSAVSSTPSEERVVVATLALVRYVVAALDVRRVES